jgi:hypothetical protein
MSASRGSLAAAEVEVPGGLASRLACSCTLEMDGHQWAGKNVTAAHDVLAGPGSGHVISGIAGLLGRASVGAPGWTVLRLPADLSDQQLRRAAAGMLAAVGRPFFSIDEGGGLWSGAESTPARDAASFGGTGRQGLHIDAPNVERIPDFTSLLVLRADPAGGGQSLIGDLHAALAQLSPADRAELSEPAYFEGRAERLRGTGAPRMPFPVTDFAGAGRPWIRWAAKMLDDPRNSSRTGVLRRFAAALDEHTLALTPGRGALLILDQQRAAHGRTALGDQARLADGTRRLIIQAKAAYDVAAPAQVLAQDSGDGHE